MALATIADLVKAPKRVVSSYATVMMGFYSSTSNAGDYGVHPAVVDSAVAITPVDGAIVGTCNGQAPFEANVKCISGFGSYNSAAQAGSMCTAVGILDLLWISGEISLTGAPTIVTPALPARANNGRDYMVGLAYGATADILTAGINVTVTYTNSDNVGGRIASSPSVNTAYCIRTLNMSSPDRGVKSVESVTISPSLAASKVLRVAIFRRLISVPNISQRQGPQTGELIAFPKQPSGMLSLAAPIPAGTVPVIYTAVRDQNAAELTAAEFTFALDM